VSSSARIVHGLTSEYARILLAEHGPNTVPSAPPAPWWRLLMLQLRDPLIIVLFVAAALTIATGDHPDAIIIGFVIAVNSIVGLVQEIKADNAIAALRQLTAAKARVVRDSQPTIVEADTIVPGDLLILGEGDIVPADAEVVEAAGLLVDESAMTGESVPVEKYVDGGAAGALAAGTVVVHGRGNALVSRTGPLSAMGRIAAGLSSAPALTPLQRRLADLGRTLAFAAAGLCLVVMTIGLVRGQPTELMVVTAISLVVAAVPESLPAVVTLSLALGARRMAARHAIVRRLPAVETLGSITVIGTDKTGTLTEGAMVAEQIWTTGREVTVTGSGFEPRGQIIDDTGQLDPDTDDAITGLLLAAALCNDAHLQPPSSPGESWAPVGDPTEAALLVAAAKLPLSVPLLREQFPRLMEIPFDSDRKRMTTVHRTPDGDFLTVCKGAPEAVLLPTVLDGPADLLAAARAQADAYADVGYRVLAVATATTARAPQELARVEQRLCLAGLIALADPPRPAAAATVGACRAAGIIPVLITGDHVATARSIAVRVGIMDATAATATGAQLAQAIPDPRVVNVFARTDPTQKLQLVDAWQRAGHVVAMTGDGVNDGPALRRADIGVAMGKRGTEIARQAADIVLTDDDLSTVVAAVEEGRRVYANVRRFLLYGLAGGAAEILVMLLGPAVGLALPLLPAQILWVNLLTHGLPGVAMGAEPGEAGLMNRPPRPPAESVIGAGLWPRVLTLGAVVAAASLGVGLWGHAAGRPWQSMVFLALGMAQFGVAIGVRARPGTWANPFLLAAVAVAFVLQLAGIYLPLLRDLLETKALHPAEATAICGVAVASYLAARAVRPRRS
jgi:Ca2+-transporting ATPase